LTTDRGKAETLKAESRNGKASVRASPNISWDPTKSGLAGTLALPGTEDSKKSGRQLGKVENRKQRGKTEG
jgi:hypothetical protein